MYTSHVLMLVDQQALAGAFLLDCPPLRQSSVPRERQSVTSATVVQGKGKQSNESLLQWLASELSTPSHHVFKNVFTQNVLLPKFQQHVLVLGKHNCPQEL